MTDRERRNMLLTLAGGGAGGTAALGLTRLRAIEDLANRHFEAGNPVVLAGTMSPELGGGSGEAKTGYKLMKLLREKHNIPAVLAPSRMPQLDMNMEWGDSGYIDGGNLAELNKHKYMPQNRITRAGNKAMLGRPMGDLLIDRLLGASGSAGKEKLREIQSLSSEEQRKIYDLLLSKKGSKVFTEHGMEHFNNALRILHSGKWDDWSVGRIYTVLKTGGLEALEHPEYWMHPDDLVKGLTSGRISSVLPLERGFKWSTLGIRPELIDSLARTDAVLKDKFNPAAWAQMTEYNPYHGKTVNLGVPTNFKINYDSPGDNLLPGITAEKPPATPAEARKLFADSRAELVNTIRELRGDKVPLKLDGKNLIFMSAGSAGPNTSAKIIDAINALDATKKDYHVLLQSGTTLAPDLPKVLEDLERTHPGKITYTPYIGSTPTMSGSARLNSLANGADLYFTYGGSSTASEAGALTTPMLFTTDWGTNLKNSDYIINRRGGNLIGGLDNRLTALEMYSRDAEKLRSLGLSGIARDKWTRGDWEKILENLKADTKVDFEDILNKDKFFRELASGEALRANNARNADLVSRMLSAESKAGRFSQAHLDNVGKFHSDLKKATDDFINTVKEHRLKGMRATAFSGSGPGGLLRRFGRLFTKNPAMAKIAPLAVIGGAAGGAGLTKYLVDKYDKNHTSIKDRLHETIQRLF